MNSLRKVLITIFPLLLVLAILTNNSKLVWLQIPLLVLAITAFILRLIENQKNKKIGDRNDPKS